MESIYHNLGGNISMPEFKGRLLYMHKTAMNEVSLPKEFNDYEEPIHNVLSKLKDRSHICYITIDEKHIKNDTHRRSGIHCDFNWYENLKNNNTTGAHGHKRVINGKWGDDSGSDGGWKQKQMEGGGMLLVSNYEGCRVWKGKFEGEIGAGGDCSNINVSKLQTEIMPAGSVYYLNHLGIHESIIIDKEVNRSLIRINLHPEYQFNC